MARLRVTYESSHAALAEEEAEAEMRAQVRSRRPQAEDGGDGGGQTVCGMRCKLVHCPIICKCL